MEMLTLIASFLLALSFLTTPCASNLQKPLQQVDHVKITKHSLPRKLINLHDKTVISSARLASSLHRRLVLDTNQVEKEENVMNAAEKEGTWRERVEEEEDEGHNKSEYFTMDYGGVRRRRPIHN